MYDLQTNLLAPTGYSAAQLAAGVRGIRPDSPFLNYIDAFADAEKKYGINSLFMVAHAAVESAWGTSYFATARNNLFGFNAYDSDPNQASAYGSAQASIDFYAGFLKKMYLTPGGGYFNGATPHGVFVKYSSSHDAEASTVVSIMNQLASHIGAPAQGESQAPAAPSANVGQQYTVVSGDTLWKLADGQAGQVDRIILANRSKYPSIGTGTDAHLEAGWTITIPGQNTAAAAQPQAVTVIVPSGPNGWLGNLASAYGTSVQQLIDWNKEKYPSIGTTVGKTPDYIQAGWQVRVR